LSVNQSNHPYFEHETRNNQWVFCRSVIASQAQIRAVSHNILYNNPCDSAYACWIDYTTRGPELYISDHYPVLLDLQFR
jgi:hypothetical protein